MSEFEKASDAWQNDEGPSGTDAACRFFWNAALDAAEKAMPSASYDTATRDGRAWNLCLSTVSERLAKLKEQA